MSFFGNFFGGPSTLQSELDEANHMAQSALGNSYSPLNTNNMQNSSLGYIGIGGGGVASQTGTAYAYPGSWINTVNVAGAGSAGPWKTPMTLKILREHEVFKLSVEELVNLWIMKLGDDWVNESEVQDEFFGFARERLQSIGRLERHYVQDGPAGVGFNAVRVVKKEG